MLEAERARKLALAGERVLPVRTFAFVVITLGFAAVAAVTTWSTSRSDAAAVADQARLVAHLLAAEIEEIAHEQESVAIWDDAVLHTAAFNYAWVDENLGVWMHDFFGHDRTYVLDTENLPIYQMADGAGLAPDAELILPDAIAGIAASVRSGAVSRPELTIVDGRPSVVSVMEIVPSSAGRSGTPMAGFLLASVRFLDGTFPENLAADYLLTGARFSLIEDAAGPEIAYPIGDGEPIGYLIWNPQRPGTTMLSGMAPWLVLTLLVFAGAILFLARRVERFYRDVAVGREEFRYQALHDPMTGLPNRARLNSALVDGLRSPGSGTAIGLLLLDLDRFKNINDAFGHPAGDGVIIETGARIRETLGTAAEVFRLGGDEFAVLVRDAAKGTLLETARRLIGAIDQPMLLPEGLVSVGVSIGAAAAGTEVSSMTELLRRADIALYAAKAAGGNTPCFFTPDLGRRAVERQRLEADLRVAIADGQLSLAFQPTRSARTNVVTGVEVLCRWIHPIRGEIPPTVFIPLAEESGLIIALGEFVVRETCRAASGWAVPAAINVSAAELRHGDYPGRLMAILRETGTPMSQIELEVTESVIVSEHDQSARAVKSLLNAGFRIAVDDFGTGYSSLRYLRSAALHRVKVDRSFLAGIATSPSARALVRGIIDLAHAIGLRVTVEGVETPAERAFLQRCGCDDLQGWLVGRPVSLQDVEAIPGVLRGGDAPAVAAGNVVEFSL